MSKSYQHYVLGFAFDDAGRVLLIRKNRPAWQAGKLNGVGGKVEPGETFLDAMVREFEEEALLRLPASAWTPFARIEGADFAVHCFRASSCRLEGATSGTDEQLEVTPVDFALLAREAQSNLVTLVANALDHDAPFAVLRYRELAANDVRAMLDHPALAA